MLSDYERQRDANVARNEAMLEQLGLKKLTQPPPKKRVRPEPSDDDSVREPSRRSGRTSKQVIQLHMLGDEYFRAEERDAHMQEKAVQRETRERKPTTFFANTQSRNMEILMIAKDGAKIDSKRRAAVPPPAAIQPAAHAGVPVIAQQQTRAISMPAPCAPVGIAPCDVTHDASVKSYMTVRPKGQCPICRDWFTLRKSDGLLHRHHCRPASVAPAAPLLPPTF
jgi:hypothetical protein